MYLIYSKIDRFSIIVYSKQLILNQSNGNIQFKVIIITKFIMNDFQVMSNKLILVFFIINIIQFLYYIFVLIFSNKLDKPSSKNYGGIETLEILTKSFDLHYTLLLKQFEYKVKYIPSSNELQMDYNTRLPILDNIIFTSIYVLSIKTKWVAMESLIQTVLHILVYIVIFSALSTFLFGNKDNILFYSLFVLWIVNFIDFVIRSTYSSDVLRIMQEHKLIDYTEIKASKKILKQWAASNLYFYFAPINDLLSLFKIHRRSSSQPPKRI